MALRRSILDRMVALMYYGSVMTVMDYIREQISDLDESLIVHFTIKTLAMFQPPYRTRFYTSALHIYASAVDALIRQAASIGPTSGTLSGHSRSSTSSMGVIANMGIIQAPAEDPVECEKALNRLREFITHPPGTNMRLKRRRLRISDEDDEEMEEGSAPTEEIIDDDDVPLSNEDMTLLEEVRLKLEG
jgi:hypothetical protein